MKWLMLLAAAAAAYAAPFPAAVEGDYTIHNFKFHDGETLADLRLHYYTIGNPSSPDAVLIMHGTGGSGKGFQSQQFGGELFGEGQPLDAARFFIIMPDAIGHGGSSKPSDGMRAHFPKYCYHDMIHADYRLLAEHLGVKHLRLVMGTSMGAMHSWLWGEMYPDFMDALMPLASAPVQIAGRNRLLRDMIMDAITSDPEYNHGDYTHPIHGLRAAQYGLTMMTSSPLQMQKQWPTRDAADAGFQKLMEAAMQKDANDMLYQFASSSDYNPEPDLEKIKARLIAVNSADDVVNPPELGILERCIKRVKNGRYVLIPTSSETRGHGTHSVAKLWKQYVLELLAR
ncbi:MAG TPA: alpha/beta fold hydrolase [Bryobacteraceae bacterium]|jgi:homoserine O-acetyltransferase|nr:alpha/beta fold hydrolase [Bryobacteraceae bacterium]